MKTRELTTQQEQAAYAAGVNRAKQARANALAEILRGYEGMIGLAQKCKPALDVSGLTMFRSSDHDGMRIQGAIDFVVLLLARLPKKDRAAVKTYRNWLYSYRNAIAAIEEMQKKTGSSGTKSALRGNAAKAAQFVLQNPGANAKQIGKHLDNMPPGSVRSHIAPKLLKAGFTSELGPDGGYYPPK